MNLLRIAWRDISSMFKNRIIRVSVAAIVIVPLLYSLLYLYAFWDPYSKLDKMPVAVVNLDKGGVNDGKTVNYGKELVKELGDSGKVGFKFVSLGEAEKGLEAKNGYYAMFVIPENFSGDVLKVKDGKPKVADIYYKSNDKKNFLASQIGGKVVLEIEKELNKKIVKEDTEVVFDNLYDIKASLKKAEDGSRKIYDNLKDAKDGSIEISEGLGAISGKVPKLLSGVMALYNGSGELYAGIGAARAGAAKLYDGASQLNKGLAEFSEKGSSLSEGVSKLYIGSAALDSGIKSANDGLKNKILPGSEALSDGISKLSLGLSGASEAAGKLNSAAAALKAAVGNVDTQSTLLNAAGALNTGAVRLKAGTDRLKPGMAQVAAGALNVKNASEGVASGVDALIAQMGSSQSALKSAAETQLSAYLAANPSAMADPNMKKFLATLSVLNAAAEDKTNLAKLSALSDGAHKLVVGAGDLSKGIDALGSGVTLFADSADQYSAGAAEYAAGAGKFTDGAGQFAAGALALGNGLGDAVKGSKALSEGAEALNNGLKTDLASGLTALGDGSVQLKAGLKDLNSNMPALKDGIGKLYEGSALLKNSLGTDNDRAKLSTGVTLEKISGATLLGGMNSLWDGSLQLKEGLGTLNGRLPALEDGANKLYSGSKDLKSGLGKLADGSRELWEKLKEGHEKLTKNLKTSSSGMAEYISAPVKIDESAINPVKNYGSGFTPYFIPLSLWVGAMLMFFIISDKVDEDIKASSASLVIGKYISYGYIGIIQAVLASTVVLILGLRPTSLVLYYSFNILMSLFFIAIIQCLIFLLGQAGRLLSIVLLILQLTSSGGTFPLEVVPKFFKVLNPFMPSTYATSGLREIISGINHGVLVQDVSVMAIFSVVFIFISVVMKKHADRVKDAMGEMILS